MREQVGADAEFHDSAPACAVHLFFVMWSIYSPLRLAITFLKEIYQPDNL
jgi:hypothetical protein